MASEFILIGLGLAFCVAIYCGRPISSAEQDYLRFIASGCEEAEKYLERFLVARWISFYSYKDALKQVANLKLSQMQKEVAKLEDL